MPRDEVRRWISSGDLLTWSAVYAIVEETPARIDPEMPAEECAEFVRRYLVRCIDENPMPGEYLHGGWEAAWLLAAHMKVWRRREARGADSLQPVTAELERMYRRADPAVRNRVLCGVLEHAFEDPELRPAFSHWDRDGDLRDAWRLALEWGRAKEP